MPNPEGAAAAATRKKRWNNSIPIPTGCGRIGFVVCLLVAAAALSLASFYLIRNSEHDLADRHFDAVADRALSEASAILLARRQSTILMASMVAENLPNASEYPFVSVKGYERIANDLLNTTQSEDTAVSLFVSPDELSAWEDFAYDFFHNDHEPTPFPDTTGVSSFGRGVWAVNPNSTAPDKRFHDVNQVCKKRYGCRYDILTPIFQVDEGPDPILMFNLHSEPVRGIAIENMLDCVYAKINEAPDGNPPRSNPYSLQDEADTGCATMLGMTQVRKFATRGPASPIFQPIRPVGDRSKVTGMIMSLTVWDSLLENVFSEQVSGVDCVLSNKFESYTYSISGGRVSGHASGDHHDRGYNHRRRQVQLTPDHLFADTSPVYFLSVYPTNVFYDSYTTDNAKIALVGTLLVMFLTSLIFFSYDACVRKDLVAKKNLLDAKRQFMRFVSHEVRTPLNAVCMGLDVIASEIKLLSDSLRKRQQEQEEWLQQQEKLEAASATSTPPTPASTTQSPGACSTTTEKTAEESLSSCSPVSEEEAKADEKTEPAPLFQFQDKAPSEASKRETARCAPPRTICRDRQQLEQHRKMAKSTEDCMHLVNEVQSSAQCAVDVLNDILNYDKIERRDLNLEITMIPIWDVVGRVVNEFRLPATNKDLDLSWTVQDGDSKSRDEEQGARNSVEDLPDNVRALFVMGDVVRLKQVLRNLLSNSIKFTPEGGSVRVHAIASKGSTRETEQFVLQTGDEVSMKHYGEVMLTVTDTGAGMTSEQLAKLFGEGVQFNAGRLQKGGGSGLGLWISKGIVERHKGTLSAHSQGLNQGTTFELGLRLHQAHGPGTLSSLSSNLESSTKRFASAGSSKLRLLIVDDASSNRKLLRRLLEMKGHICDDAENGQIAVDKISQGNCPFDSILMDYEMPVMDGPTATKAIRSLGYKVFIVGVTGNMLAEDVAFFRSCGANAVVGKPVKLKMLEDLWMESGILLTDDSSQQDSLDDEA